MGLLGEARPASDHIRWSLVVVAAAGAHMMQLLMMDVIAYLAPTAGLYAFSANLHSILDCIPEK